MSGLEDERREERTECVKGADYAPFGAEGVVV